MTKDAVIIAREWLSLPTDYKPILLNSHGLSKIDILAQAVLDGAEQPSGNYSIPENCADRVRALESDVQALKRTVSHMNTERVGE